MKATELTQGIECPACGWENGFIDSGQGLNATERKCRNKRCCETFVAVWRQDEFVGVASLTGRDVDAYRNALRMIGELTEIEVGLLVGQARQRSQREPFRHGAASA